MVVAEVALWIARLKANSETAMLLDIQAHDFPLSEKATIVQANALRVAWEEILPAKDCSYIMGNPPFVGYLNHTKEQQQDRASIFGKVKTVDYVACWYWKAADYVKDYSIRCVFVSTNSICQGQQPEPIFKPLFTKGFHIDFAHTSFEWHSESDDKAHVWCVIVGFSKQDTTRMLFRGKEILYPQNINAYLTPANNVFIEKHNKPLCEVPSMAQGCKSIDGGSLLLSEEEYKQLLKKYPQVQKYIRPFSMGEEFVKDINRYCLWFTTVDFKELDEMDDVRERVRSVKAMRLASTRAATQKIAQTPWLFAEIKEPKGVYIGIPKVTSSRRTYVPFGFVTNNMIPGDKLYFIESNELYHLGVMLSQVQNAWMRAVAGRLGMGYSYSNTIVYNNFIWPTPTPKQKEKIEACAQAVLDARANHLGESLAKMYDGISPLPENPTKADKKKYDLFQYSDLLDAHIALDKAVEEAYGVEFNGDEEKIVAHLFDLYAEKIAELEGE